jgi:hypothetical protein
MSLERDCQEVEVTPNLLLFITFGMTLEGRVMNLIHNHTTSS